MEDSIEKDCKSKKRRIDDALNLKSEKTVKSVRFSEKKPSIRYYTKAEEEDGNAKETTDGASAQSSCLTNELSMLSTTHSRARRELRNMTTHDIKTIVRYGTKSRAATVKGEVRWKFQYGNMTVITDDSCTTAITSYRDEISIEPAQITPNMEAEHLKTCRILQKDYNLITTHCIVIVDQR